MATLVNSTYTAGTLTTAITPVIGTHQANDRIVVVLHGKYSSTTIPSSANGFTRIGSAGGGTGGTGNDIGTVFQAVYVIQATGSTHTLALTAGATAPNSWGAWAHVVRLDAGESWTETVASMALVFVSDTDTASPLAGTTGTPGTAVNSNDIVLVTGAIPTDSGSALTAGTTITATGLSGGTVNEATTQYGENNQGADCASVWATWDGFTGTSSSGFTVSFTVTGSSNHAGVITAVPLRVTAALTAAVATATETDTAVAIGPSKRLTIGTAAETDTAQVLVRLKQAPIGIAAEADTALPLARIKRLTIGAATETDTALVVATPPISAAIGTAAETDTATTLSGRKTRAITPATETDTAQPIARTKTRSLSVATETDAATPVNRRKARALGQAFTNDTALVVTRLAAGALGTTFETDTAPPVNRRKTLTIGTATGTDTAVPLTRTHRRPLGTAADTSTAGVLGRIRERLVGIATDLAQALPFARTKRALIGIADETDTALAVAPSSAMPRDITVTAAINPPSHTAAITDTGPTAAIAGSRHTAGGITVHNSTAATEPTDWEAHQ